MSDGVGRYWREYGQVSHRPRWHCPPTHLRIVPSLPGSCLIPGRLLRLMSPMQALTLPCDGTRRLSPSIPSF